MSIVNQLKQKIRFRGKSFLAMVLEPELPLDVWFEEIDRILKRSPGFFSGKPIMLDCSGLNLMETNLKQLLGSLREREILVMGIEGVAQEDLGEGMPPVVSGGRAAKDIEVNDNSSPKSPQGASSGSQISVQKSAAGNSGNGSTVSSMCRIIDHPIRSGQTISCPEGDLTVIGSISSGAELIAGGSIHVYGSLRGRALAGTSGENNSRIFCSNLDAELVSINGIYKTAEDIGSEHLNKPVRIQLESEDLVIVNQ